MQRALIFLMLVLSVPATAGAEQLSVITTTTDLAEMVRVVGGDHVAVESLAMGVQDPHYLEPRPSFMVKVAQADFVVAVGLDLEVGWLPTLLDGARNPRVRPGGPGYIDASTAIEPMGATGRADRAAGDVHAQGNPHYMLDPLRAARVAEYLAERFSVAVSPDRAARFAANAAAFRKDIEARMPAWTAALEAVRARPVVTYHATYDYFLARFHIHSMGYLEPKPGVPPSPAYLLDLQKRMKPENTSVILFENLYPSGLGKRVSAKTGVPLVVAPVMVGGADGVDTYARLIDTLIRALTDGAGR